MGFRLTHYAIWTGLVLAAGSCCFSPVFAGTPPVEIRDSIPLHEAGIGNNVRVARNTSFAVLIVAAHGVDLTDPDNIRFVIDDEVRRPYVRDLGDDTVRVIKLNDDKDRRATQFWLVYDRALETYMPDSYGIDAIVMISVTIRDIYNNYFPPSVFEFKIESEAEYAAALQNMPETVALDPSDPILEGVYDTGIEVVSGDLTGAKIIYASSEPLAPMFGPLDEIAPLDAADQENIGVPINLQPHTVFNVPVRIFIPNPAQADLSEIGIYYYNGLRWQLAWDADAGGLDAGFGWVPTESGVRISDDDPAQIVMDAHHFSGIQAAVFTSFNSSEDDKKDHSGSGATVFISCFIDAAGAGNLPDVWIFAVIGLLLAGFALSNSEFGMGNAEGINFLFFITAL